MKLKSMIAVCMMLLTVSFVNAQVSTDYYKYSEVIFCEEVVDGKAVSASSSFTIGASGGYVTVQVDNGKPMKTVQLIVDVWKKSSSGDYDKFIETKKYTIKSTWDSPYFEYTFYNAGKYKLSIYNEDEVFVNSGYVTINMK